MLDAVSVFYFPSSSTTIELSLLTPIRQGLASAQTGRSHSFSEDDYLLLRAPCWSPPTLASISNETSCEISDSGQLFKSLLDAYVYHLAMTLAETPQRLTGRESIFLSSTFPLLLIIQRV